MSTPGGRALAVFLCVCILLSCVSSLVASPAIYDLVLARQGIQHLKNAETDFKALSHNPLNADAIAQAHDELAAAYSDFSQVNATIGLYSGLLTISPHYHTMLEGARALLPIAIEASRAGMIGCDMLSLVSSRLKDPLDASSPGLTTADMAVINQDAAQVFAIVNTVIPRLDNLPPSVNTLDPRIGPALASFRKSLPQVQQELREAQVWLAAAPALLGIGQDTNYLVEVLDSSELRAGGGFIGNYGVIELHGGKVTMHLQDVTLLDQQGLHINDQFPPQGYEWLYRFSNANFYGFRESNLEADFPWVAQTAEQMYQLEAQNDQTAHLYTLTPGGPVPVQGVIAITPWVIQDAMKVTGGVYLPEFKTNVTWDTLVDDIHAAQLGPNKKSGLQYNPIAGSSERKLFSEDLFKHFFGKVKSLLSTDGSKLVSLFVHALYTKDVQVYLNDPNTEALLQKHHVDSTIDAPAKGDSLMIVDANVNAEKDNFFMTNLLQDQVTVDEQGNATHQMTLDFNFPQSDHTEKFDFGHLDINYWEWMRVYVPPGSTVINDGWGIASTDTKFGRQVWAGAVGQLNYPGSLTVTLSWVVPNAAYKDAHGWHYMELLQRQAGLVRPVDMQVTLPACASHITASVTQAGGGAAPVTSVDLPAASMPGSQVPDVQNPSKLAPTVDKLLAGITGTTPRISHQSVTMNQVLTEDHTIAVNYTCG